MKGYLKVSERYDNACTTGCHYLQTPLLQLRAVRHFYFHFQGWGPLTRAQKSPLKVCKISPANSSGKKTSESITTDQISNCCSRQLCSTLYRSPSLFLVHKHYNHEWIQQLQLLLLLVSVFSQAQSKRAYWWFSPKSCTGEIWKYNSSHVQFAYMYWTICASRHFFIFNITSY